MYEYCENMALPSFWLPHPDRQRTITLVTPSWEVPHLTCQAAWMKCRTKVLHSPPLWARSNNRTSSCRALYSSKPNKPKSASIKTATHCQGEDGADFPQSSTRRNITCESTRVMRLLGSIMQPFGLPLNHFLPGLWRSLEKQAGTWKRLVRLLAE